MLAWSLLLPVLLWSAAAMTSDEDDSQLRVRTTQGWLQGSYTTTRGGRKVRQFLGIRYAKSPDGERSFKSPEPVDPWEGVRDATTECDLCMQQFTPLLSLRYTVQGSDDCLCMNIFVPIIKANKEEDENCDEYIDDTEESEHLDYNEDPHDLVPCVFYIYGSAYMGLDNRKLFYGPEMLLDKNICLIVVSHRLAILGFLSTEDEIIPGNFALKDTALALRWVKENIKHFGGNPDSITVMGQSTGADTAQLNLYSPLTRDLFHRVIMDSGSALCPWSFSEPGEHTKKAQRLAEMLECPFHPTSEFLACLQNMPSANIVNKTHCFLVSIDADPTVYFNPCIEKKTVKDAFLTENPYCLSSTKPMLAGYNYAEGMMKVSSLTSGDVEAKFKEWNENFECITPYRLFYYDRTSDLDYVTKRVRDFYFGPNNKVIMPSMVKQMVDMCGDFWFNQGILDAVVNHRGPKWLYHFNYNTTVSVCSKLYSNPLNAGVAHLDELMYLFPMNITEDNFVNPCSPDYKMSLIMVELWTSFMTDSVPTAAGITWTPVRSSALEYLEIENSGFTMRKRANWERRKFWKSLPLMDKNTCNSIIVYN